MQLKAENERLRQEAAQQIRPSKSEPAKTEIKTEQKVTPKPTVQVESELGTISKPTSEQLAFQKLVLWKKLRRFAESHPETNELLEAELFDKDEPQRENVVEPFQILVDWLAQQSGRTQNPDHLWEGMVRSAQDHRRREETRQRQSLAKAPLDQMLRVFRLDNGNAQGAIWNEAKKDSPDQQNVQEQLTAFRQFATEREATLPEPNELWDQIVRLVRRKTQPAPSRESINEAWERYSNKGRRKTKTEALKKLLNDPNRLKAALENPATAVTEAATMLEFQLEQFPNEPYSASEWFRMLADALNPPPAV